MLDRTPELFGPRADLARISDEAVGITAVDAIEFLDRVQIREMMAIDHEMVFAAYPRNSVNAKTEMLKNGDRKIENDQRDDHAVDNGCRQDVGDRCLAQVPP